MSGFKLGLVMCFSLPFLTMSCATGTGMYANPIMLGDWSDPGLIRVGSDYYWVRSGLHLRNGKRGDPDLGWVGRYKEPNLSMETINGLPENQRQAKRAGNVWTAATFGVFAVQDGAVISKAADFDYFRVSHPNGR